MHSSERRSNFYAFLHHPSSTDGSPAVKLVPVSLTMIHDEISLQSYSHTCHTMIVHAVCGSPLTLSPPSLNGLLQMVVPACHVRDGALEDQVTRIVWKRGWRYAQPGRLAVADAAALSSIEERRDRAKQYAGKVGGPKPAPAKSKKKDPPQPPVVIPDTFGGRQRNGTGESLPSRMTTHGTLLWGFFVLSFGFYLFCRSTTISATNNAVSTLPMQWCHQLRENVSGI
jgi:hypothetical protein